MIRGLNSATGCHLAAGRSRYTVLVTTRSSTTGTSTRSVRMTTRGAAAGRGHRAAPIAGRAPPSAPLRGWSRSPAAGTAPSALRTASSPKGTRGTSCGETCWRQPPRSFLIRSRPDRIRLQWHEDSSRRLRTCPPADRDPRPPSAPARHIKVNPPPFARLEGVPRDTIIADL